MDASQQQRPALIEKYLKHWAKILSESRGDKVHSFGHSITKSHITNKTLHKEIVGKYPNYRGNWAWEIVCLVKLLNIDNSSFRDHEFYPVEMVDYLKSKE